MRVDPSDDYLKRRAPDAFDLELPWWTPLAVIALALILDFVARRT